MTIGEKLRKLRLSRDWTQKELGAKTGLGNNISSYETGHLKPSEKTLKKLLDAFGLTAAEFMASEDGPQDTELKDDELVTLLQALTALPEPEVQKAKWFLNMLVKQHRLQQMIAS